MKTLDEVIKAMENCYGSDAECCDKCSYTMEVTGHGVICRKCDLEDDALHYLREYRKLDSLDAVAFPEDDNPAMTWDELKQMEGKPVWVEYNLHLSDKDARSRSRMWIIVQKIMPWRQDDELIYYSGFVFSKKEIGKTWQAYRKERLES